MIIATMILSVVTFVGVSSARKLKYITYASVAYAISQGLIATVFSCFSSKAYADWYVVIALLLCGVVFIVSPFVLDKMGIIPFKSLSLDVLDTRKKSIIANKRLLQILKNYHK
jgi:hypothetical protein